MKSLVEAFPTHLKEALTIGQSATFTNTDKQFENIVISGLGGSGMSTRGMMNTFPSIALLASSRALF
jgi:hypothetical protein